MSRVLAAILLTDEPPHVRRLAAETSLPYSTVQREIDRLEQAGVVRTTRSGATRVVHVDDRYPYLPELRTLVLKAYGPTAVLAELLDGVDGVDEAYIYGSWASRYEGDWGSAPRDVDLLVVGSPSADRIDVVAAEAEQRIGQPVHPTIVSAEEWHDPSSGFVRTVKAGSRVRLAVGGRA